jgi:hypothetical protein
MTGRADDTDEAIERLGAELDAEFARVGITWDALLAELARSAVTRPSDDAAPGALTLGLLFEFTPALAALRVLPAGAGVAPFAAWVRGTPAWHTIWAPPGRTSGAE